MQIRNTVYPCRVEDTAGVAVPEVQQLWVTPGLTSKRFNPVKINSIESELRRCSVVIVDIGGVVRGYRPISGSQFQIPFLLSRPNLSRGSNIYIIVVHRVKYLRH